MNFFEHQDQARKNTTLLLCLFAVSVITTIVALYVALTLVLYFADVEMAASPQAINSLWSPSLFGMVTLGTVSLVGAGTLWRLASLQGGGGVVARELGGQLVSLNTDDPDEQRLLNVVAEMAIASGIPVPEVYVLPQEPGINAFAAGFSPDRAVIGVTRGCLEQLTRDELQGVIAHEFSHILNGDMRLNLRLIGVLHGILLIYLLGRGVLRANFDARGHHRNGGVFIFVLGGLALVVVGSVGFFCGRAIKSAVSRQREFLADAAAVQFTRNPEGIGSALRKLGGYAQGSGLQTDKAEEHSHLFFGRALDDWLFPGLFATHPPLEERIRRLTGVRVVPRSRRSAAATPLGALEGLGLAGEEANSQKPVTSSSSTTQIKAGSVIMAVGTTDPEHLAYAQTLLEGLPAALRAAVCEPQGALAVLYGLALDRQAGVRQQQLALVASDSPELARATQTYGALIAQLEPRLKLSLVDLTLPALRQCSREELKHFLQRVKQLAAADGKISFSEYILQLILQRRLQPYIRHTEGRSPSQFTNLGAIWDDCAIVLTALARVGHTTPQNVTYAFRSGMFRLPGASKRGVPPEPPPCSLGDINRSLQRLERAAPKLKQAIVDACAHTVLVDSRVTVREAELLRAIAIALGCPLPPFLEVP